MVCCYPHLPRAEKTSANLLKYSELYGRLSLCTWMEQPVFSWQGPGGITGEAGHPREPGGLEAKAPLGLAVTTLLRGKQTQPSWGGEEAAT